MIAFALEAGVDVNARDKLGRTALHESFESLMEPAVLQLLGAGADLESLDNSGCVPWHVSLASSNSTEDLGHLIESVAGATGIPITRFEEPCPVRSLARSFKAADSSCSPNEIASRCSLQCHSPPGAHTSHTPRDDSTPCSLASC